jgi:hypothetical protein
MKSRETIEEEEISVRTNWTLSKAYECVDWGFLKSVGEGGLSSEIRTVGHDVCDNCSLLCMLQWD